MRSMSTNGLTDSDDMGKVEIDVRPLKHFTTPTSAH